MHAHASLTAHLFLRMCGFWFSSYRAGSGPSSLDIDSATGPADLGCMTS